MTVHEEVAHPARPKDARSQVTVKVTCAVRQAGRYSSSRTVEISQKAKSRLHKAQYSRPLSSDFIAFVGLLLQYVL